MRMSDGDFEAARVARSVVTRASLLKDLPREAWEALCLADSFMSLMLSEIERLRSRHGQAASVLMMAAHGESDLNALRDGLAEALNHWALWAGSSRAPHADRARIAELQKLLSGELVGKETGVEE